MRCLCAFGSGEQTGYSGWGWPLPQLFQRLRREGKVADAKMHRTFNCDIGMIVV